MHLMGRRQSTLCTLSLSPQLLHCAIVSLDVYLVLALDELGEVVHHPVIKVLSSKVCVSTGGNHLQTITNMEVNLHNNSNAQSEAISIEVMEIACHQLEAFESSNYSVPEAACLKHNKPIVGMKAHLEDSIVNCQDGDIKGATTEVKNKDVLFSSLLVKSIGQCCCCGLIEDSRHMQTSNDTYRKHVLQIHIQCQNHNCQERDQLGNKADSKAMSRTQTALKKNGIQ